MKCKNCEEDIKKGWKMCPKCGANLELGTYSSDDDPVEEVKKIRRDVDAIKIHLEKEHAEKTKDQKEPRKPLFG